MIYANDDTDRGLRKRSYLLTVFVFPVITTLVIAGIIYYIYSKQYISETDRNYCYFLAFGAGAFLFAMNRRKWLKMPDGSYYSVQNEVNQPDKVSIEPPEYDRIYYISKTKKIISVAAGIIIAGMGIFIFGNNKNYSISIITTIAGLFSIYNGIKGVLDKTPKLKLSTEGLWTNKLGFVNWNNISDAKVITEGSDEHPSIILEIYLKGTIFSEANSPDERLVLNDIADNKFIDIDIERLFGKRSEAIPE